MMSEKGVKMTTPEQEAFQRFVAMPVKTFLVSPSEFAELERRAHALVSKCFRRGLVTEQELSEQMTLAFVRLINTHVKYQEPIVPDEHWLD